MQFAQFQPQRNVQGGLYNQPRVVQGENRGKWRNFSDSEASARLKRLSSPPSAHYGNDRAEVNTQQQQYALQQQQLALQLEALKLQNLEFQEKLMQAMNANQRTPSPEPEELLMTTHRSRPTSLIYDANNVPLVFDEQAENATRQQRKGALANLQKAQQNRYSDTFSDGLPSPGLQNGFSVNRLSFTGGDGLAERAMARKAAQEAANTFRGHTRAASSVSSMGSPMLSETHKQMTSPSGPTLVLSQPGDDFPSPTLGRGKSKSLKIGLGQSPQKGNQTESDSTASSPRTPDSESEAKSFESTTSYGSDRDVKSSSGMGIGFAPQQQAVRRVVSQGGLKLNPAASTFNPNASTFTPPVPQLAAAFKPYYRNFSAPSAYTPALLNNVNKPIRQPKGPCADEDLPLKNFAGRVRARAINTLLKGRLSAPPSPTDITHFSVR